MSHASCRRIHGHACDNGHHAHACLGDHNRFGVRSLGHHHTGRVQHAAAGTQAQRTIAEDSQAAVHKQAVLSTHHTQADTAVLGTPIAADTLAACHSQVGEDNQDIQAVVGMPDTTLRAAAGMRAAPDEGKNATSSLVEKHPHARPWRASETA